MDLIINLSVFEILLNFIKFKHGGTLYKLQSKL